MLADDLLRYLEPPYTVLISNPPYLREAEHAVLQPEVAGYESRHALVAEENGLIFYEKIASQLDTLLAPDGSFWLEIGHEQSQDVQAIFADHNISLTVKNDMSGKPRFAVGTRT
jgi:release factor glutamine methyltransferase